MNWSEFSDARLLLSEERVGRPLRAHDRHELDADERAKAILRARGM